MRAGLTADLLRAWEKRYHVVTPVRTKGGHRLYSDEDVARLALIREAQSSGRRIGDIARLGRAELEELVAADRAAVTTPAAASGAPPTAEAEAFVTQALAAARAYDAHALRALLQRVAALADPQTLVDQYVAPLMHAIGSLWARGELQPGPEHVATTAVRRIVEDLFLALQPGSAGPGIVVATPAGQRHELGALLAAATAAVEGWRVTYLGADLPAEDIVAAVVRTDADAVALSITTPDANVVEAVEELRRGVGRAFPILAGGQGAELLESGPEQLAIRLRGLVSLRAVLGALRSEIEGGDRPPPG